MGELRVRVQPRANEAACRLLASRLGVSPSRVAVVRGVSSRDKLIRVEGLDSSAVRRQLGL